MMRLWAASATVAVVASIGGGFLAAKATPWDPPVGVLFGPPGAQVSADLDEGGNGRQGPPSVDPNVDFPDALTELPDLPEHLAVDPATGDLWFVMFSYGGDNTLYHYRDKDGRVETRAIPASTGSSLFSDIGVDSRGRVISAEGDTVLVIDPAGGYEELPLPRPANLAEQRWMEGTYVIDMELSPDGKAYLTRINVAAITELDLESGESREIPVPSSLGQVHYIALSGDLLWMTAPYSTESTPSQTAVLDLADGRVTITAIKSTDLAADGDSGVIAGGPDTPGLARMDQGAIDAVPISPSTEASSRAVRQILREPGVIAVDGLRGTVWLASVGRRGIVSLNPVDGAMEYYELPSWGGTWLTLIPPECRVKHCDPPGGGWTRVGDFAVAPNGDVYFSDQSFNRIGVVHPR